MNEWESSQTSNRLELMMKKNIGHAQSFSYFLSFSLSFSFSPSPSLSLALFSPFPRNKTSVSRDDR